MATGGRRKTNRTKKEETNWQERVIQIRRVSKVVKGGKKLSFRAIVVVGNERGQVGVGVGKASDVIGAVALVEGLLDGVADCKISNDFSKCQHFLATYSRS